MKMIEMYEFNSPGYSSLFSYNEWRVAILNYLDDLEIERINYLEAHLETDEVFVLLEGECQMILADFDNNNLTKLEIVSLKKNKIYNIPQGIYHNHTLSKDAKLLIVEQADTGDTNSQRIYLNKEDQNKIVAEWRRVNEL